MQTFLPWPDFEASARTLDDRRLGKQRVETLQILRALHVPDYGWASHPAVTMWRGHTPALVAYGIAIVDEWEHRGKADATRPDIGEFVHPQDPPSQASLVAAGQLPPWLGDEALHQSHRSNLLRKDPEHYRPHFPDDPDDLDYVWPEPPAPSPTAAPSAWVVRSRVDRGRLSLPIRAGETPWVPLDARGGRITKRLRQVARFIDEMRVGDRVVALGDGGLDVAVVTGDHERGAEHLRRPVRVVGTLPRVALDAPALLQDPQDVFVLRGEPVLDGFDGAPPTV